MKAMILAAGLGTRMRPLTDKIPKPLLLVAGKPLIEYHVDRLVAAGITELVINHAYLGEQIEQYLGDGSRLGANILYSRESEPLETGGGIYRALTLLGDEPFIVVNSDVWADYPLEKLLLRKESGEIDLAHLVMVQNPEHNQQGDFVLSPDGLLAEKKLSEKGMAESANAPSLTFSGISLMTSELFAQCVSGQFPLLPLLTRAMSCRRVGGEYYAGEWIDVGTPQRLIALDKSVREGGLI